MRDNDILNNIYDSISDSIVLIDKNGIILYTNNAFTELLNYKESDLINYKLNQFTVKTAGEYYTNNSDLINVDDGCIEEIKNKIALIQKDGSISNLQNYYINKDNKIIIAEQNVNSIYNEKSNNYTVASDQEFRVNNNLKKRHNLKSGDVLDFAGSTVVFDDDYKQ